MASVLKVDKLDPQSGTALEIGTSGDTITVPSGATFNVAGTMQSGGITVGNTPYFFAYRGTSEQSIADATQTIIEYNAELYDSGSCFDTGTYKFTPNVAGKYWIQATARIADSTNADNINLEIWKSGSTVSRTNTSNRNYSSVWNSVIVDMDGSSDYIQAKIYQDTGGSANIGMNSDSTYQTFLQGFFIGS